MILERTHVLTLLATAGALGLAPGETAAQSTPTDSLRIPALMISVGAGGAKDMGDWRDGGPVQVVSAQFLVGRHLAVEGEAVEGGTRATPAQGLRTDLLSTFSPVNPAYRPSTDNREQGLG